LYKEGQEESTIRIDDLQIFLTSEYLNFGNKDEYKVITNNLPDKYRYYNRLTVYVSNGDCNEFRLKSMFIENGNVDDYLTDYNKSPSFDFEETFHTLLNNKFEVYHNNDFEIQKIELYYYRDPLKINIYDNTLSLEELEIKNDLFYLIADETTNIIGGDTSNMIASQIAEKRVEQNN
jgi:hypothetical protein